MFASKWIYELMLLIYSISVIGYFIDFIKHNRRINKIAFIFLLIVWVMQTIILYNQTFIKKNFPILTLNDGLFFYAWLLITFSIIVNRLFAIHFIVFFANLFSFFILLLSITLNAQKESIYIGASQFVHEILIIHIVISLISYGFFTISFLLSMMYLLQSFLLKRKIGLRWIWRLTNLKQLDLFSFQTIVIGVPLLLIGLILGIVWAYVTHTDFYWFDIKIIGSIAVLFVYIIYLMLRLIKKYQGKLISIYNTAAFLCLLINFFLFSSLSDFHF